jgi:hypothetical protein
MRIRALFSTAREASVQIALLLDTSNSMDGLIEQAKTQLWSVINEFLRAKRDGQTPVIEVALYEYGNNGLKPEEGFVRLVAPLTDDLDLISEQLFALKTNGGEEFCGQVVRDAVAQLKWNPSSGVYKTIFIAGNEPFTQGTVDFRQSCRAAIEKGILVNTIFCGPLEQGEESGWKEGATLADGRFLTIDPNQKLVSIPTPQDEEISRLGLELNKTYIPYGKVGQVGQARQVAQDVNADALSLEAKVTRSVTRSCAALYSADDWDLVDAIRTGKCKLEELKAEDLPENLRKLSPSELRASVEKSGKERDVLQKQILSLNTEREKFLSIEYAKLATQGEETFLAAVLKAVREQATRANIRFE